VSADWIAILVFAGIGALTLDVDGWENVLCLLGLALVCVFPIWLFA